MRKFAGLSLALVMCVSTAIAHEMASTASGSSHSNSRNNDDQMFRSMDSSLAAKLKDYLQIIDRIQKVSASESAAKSSSHANVLSGDKAAPPKFRPRTHPAAKAIPAPWWHGFELNMVFYSSKSRTAVVNGKYVREGDIVRQGVSVKKIDSQSVTLEYTDGSGTSAPDNQENLKTLLVKQSKG